MNRTGVPCFLEEHPALQATVTLLLLVETGLTGALVDQSPTVNLAVNVEVGVHQMTLEVLAAARRSIASVVRGWSDGILPGIKTWLASYGFEDLLSGVRQGTGSDEPASHLTRVVRTAVSDLQTIVAGIADEHLENLIERDLPGLPRALPIRSDTLGWVIAADTVSADRDIIVRRRRAALTRYAAIHRVLLEPIVREAVDKDQGIEDTLASAIGSSGARDVNAFEGTEDLAWALASQGDRAVAIREMIVHAIPHAEWPRSHQEWARSPWAEGPAHRLFRPDYVSQPTTRAFLDGVRQDLLQPLLLERARAYWGGAIDHAHARALILYGDLPANGRIDEDAAAARAHYIRSLSLNVIGIRSASAFEDVLQQWDRYRELSAMLRVAAADNLAGWDLLQDVWTSRDGRTTAHEISNGQEMLELGLTSGRTFTRDDYIGCRGAGHHLIVLAKDGQPDTVLRVVKYRTGPDSFMPEVKFLPSDTNPSTDDDQRNTVHSWLGSFASDPARRKGDLSSSWDPSKLQFQPSREHAIRAYPLYRPFLAANETTGKAPETWEAWQEQNGLRFTVDELLAATAAQAKPQEPR